MNARLALLLVLGIVHVTIPVAGQSPAAGVVTGAVLDAFTGMPVPGAELRLVRAGAIVRSLGDGAFRFAGAHGADTLRVRAIGYLPIRLAWSPAAGRSMRVLLTNAPTTLPDLVAIGGVRIQSSAEIVMPVLRVDRREIEATGATSVVDVLRELPGLQATTAPPTAAGIMIRGSGDGRVLVLRDGQPAPGQMLEDRDLSRLSTVGVEQIEVVKGPLSVIHGSQALGGVINIVSRAPEGPFRVEGAAHGGSLGRRDASLTLQAGGQVAWRGSLGWRQQDRLPGQVERDGTLQRMLDAQASLRTTVGQVAVRVDASAFRERQRWAVGGGFFGFNDNSGVTAWSEAAVDRLGGSWRLRVTGQEFRHRFRQALGDVPFEGTGAPVQQERMLRVQLSHSRQLAGKHQLDAGIEASRRRVVAADRLIGERLGDAMVEGFVQDAVHLGPALLTAAARVTHNSRWGNAVTPSVGLALEPTGALRLRVGTARGFRGPTFKELGWNFLNAGAGYTVEGNTALVPESSWQLFAGATWAVRPDLVLEADIYRNALRDMIDLALVGSTEAGLLRYTPRNLARARTQGVELAARYTGTAVRLAASYERLDATDLTTGRPLSQRAPHAARLRASGDLWANARLDVTGRWTAAAPVLDAGGTRLPDQDALLAWDVAMQLLRRDGIRLEAGVDNVFDARPSGWQVALRRTARLGMRFGVGR